MAPVSVDVFFSCSFADHDKPVNSHFMAIARALGMRLSNVSTGYAATPPDVAKEKIAASQAVLAICSKRDKFESGKYAMPQAVHDEISFAYGANIPVLMIVENDVEISGFKSNFGTYLPFDTLDLLEPDFLEKSIEAIHILKLKVVEPHHVGLGHGISEATADYVHHLVELKCDAGKYKWAYGTTKRLTFNKASKRGFPSSVWCTVPTNVAADAEIIEYAIDTISSSRGIKVVPTVETQTAEKVDAVLKMEPSPEENDFVEYSTIIAGRYINPVWLDEAAGSEVHLESGDYACADGLILIHRTQNAVLEFRFPREYGFRRGDVKPFVGSYSSSLDYEVPSELERATIKIDEFGGNLIVRMELISPLPGHMYGIAWNPRKRPE